MRRVYGLPRLPFAIVVFAVLALGLVAAAPAHAANEGYWTDWHGWSDWSATPVQGSDARQVETRQVPTSYDMEVYVCGDSHGVRSYLAHMQGGYSQRAHYKETWPADRVNSVATVPQGAYHNGPSSVAGRVVGPGTGYLDQNQVPFFIVGTNYETQYRYRERTWIAIHTITWVSDGVTLKTDEVNNGLVPMYSGAVPIKKATPQYSYKFKGWSPAVAAAYDDAVYTATFTSSLRSYTVIFTNGIGKTLTTQKVVYGKAATAPAAPKRSGYTFSGWDKSFSRITGNLTVSARWKLRDGKTLLAGWTVSG